MRLAAAFRFSFWSCAWSTLAALVACGDLSAPATKGDDPFQPGLAFAHVPASAHVNGRFEVRVRINDPFGARVTRDSTTAVTIRALGGGTLRGTLTRTAVAGQVVFDDLRYDRWEPLRLAVSAPGFGERATRATFPVRPIMRFAEMPPVYVASGVPFGPLKIELVDGQGRAMAGAAPVELEAADADLDVTGGAGRTFQDGRAEYPTVVLRSVGGQTLVLRSPGLGDLIHAVVVHDEAQVESLWAPSARVDVPYRFELPGDLSNCRLMAGTLPRGLQLEPDGEIVGSPRLAGNTSFAVGASRRDGPAIKYQVSLSVYPDGETAPAPLDSAGDEGPFAVGEFDETIAVPSRRAMARVRVYHPTPSKEGQVANGLLPLIVFHHGAGPLDPQRPAFYDRFDGLLERWASHGFVVVTIDALDLVWAGTRLVNATLANMNAMAENQRAAIVWMRTRAAAPPLDGRVDLERVVVAGHSRGAGASLVTARAEPSVVAGILIKPLDPLATVGGEKVWNGPLPRKPFLVVLAGNDGDVPYPMADYLYERRSAAMTAVTMLGSVHFASCDGCMLDVGVTAEITREQDWAITNAYAVPFLKHFARGEVSWAPLLFGREGQSTTLSPRGVLVRSDRNAAPLVVDDFQDEMVARNSLGLPSTGTGFTWSTDEPSMVSALRELPESYQFLRTLYGKPENLARSNAHRLEWTERATYATELGGVDVRGRTVFALRARSDRGPLAGSRLTFRFVDGEGVPAVVAGGATVGTNGIGTRFTDVIVPTASIAAAGAAMENLARIEIVLEGGAAESSIVIDDLRFE